jgi:hypothetical protein
MIRKKEQYVVSLVRPDGVSVAEMEEFIAIAVCAEVGVHDQRDPLSKLDRRTIFVRRQYRSRQEKESNHAAQGASYDTIGHSNPAMTDPQGESHGRVPEEGKEEPQARTEQGLLQVLRRLWPS